MLDHFLFPMAKSHRDIYQLLGNSNFDVQDRVLDLVFCSNNLHRW